jgi:Na+/proline symporter
MMFLFAFVLLLLVLISVAWFASRNVQSVDQFVLSGQGLGLRLCTCSLLATWFGAESLLTLSDEVSRVGLSCIWIDPIGIALCLWIAGLWVVPRIYRRDIATIGDLFRQSGDRRCELLCSIIIVPSYFGWIAAQLIALGLVLKTYLHLDATVGCIAMTCFAACLCLWGGNNSVGWLNTLLLLLIIVGLVCLTGALLHACLTSPRAQPSPSIDLRDVPDQHWEWFDPSSRGPWLGVLGALAVGSVGNLPTIELLQRIRSARTEMTAKLACYIGGLAYLLLGSMPIFFGLCHASLNVVDETVSAQALSALSLAFLSAPFQVLLFIAIVATVLSTLIGAAVAPASMLSLNVVEPIAKRVCGISLHEAHRLRSQRMCVVVLLALSTLLALSGETAFQLVRDSYGMLLGAIVVPFLALLGLKKPPKPTALLAAMLAGAASWAAHWWFDQTHFAGPWLEAWLPLPHELGDALLSAATLVAFEFAIPLAIFSNSR